MFLNDDNQHQCFLRGEIFATESSCGFCDKLAVQTLTLHDTYGFLFLSQNFAGNLCLNFIAGEDEI